MKVLFLDIDGVLNSAEYTRLRRSLPRPSPHSIDALAVPRLNAITDRTGAAIVVSSTWRLQEPPDHDPGPVWRLRRILGAHGVTGEILDVTPWLSEEIPCATPDGRSVLRQLERGHEIQRWLDGRRDVEAFAILDDRDDMVHLRDRLVQTTWERGLQDEHVERVVTLLGQRGAR
ncbi:MAG TPA: HAD domain-containing protein [Gammaproteobacteria bacterium]|nr:HAD domain-containing protein [Gammaproteobacteria bacterium]